MPRAEGGDLGKGTKSQMKLKVIAVLSLFCCCPVIFAEPLASASYKDVCEQMDEQGISSRTQSDPNSQQLVENAVVVVGAGQTSRRKQTQLVANSDIAVGTSVNQLNTLNSGPNRANGAAAESADTCR